MKYRKRPVIVDAVQLRWDTWNEICHFIPIPEMAYGVLVHDRTNEYINEHKSHADYNRIGMIIKTLEGDMLAIENDYIVKGVNGEFYPCKPDIFYKTYELYS